MVPDSGCEKRTYRSMSSTGYLLSSWRRRKRWGSGLLRTVCPYGYCFRTSLEEERHLALFMTVSIHRLSARTAPGWHGMGQEALTTCRGGPQHSDQICHSILAQQVSYHRRVIHIVVIIIVHRGGLGIKSFGMDRKDSGAKMRTTCVGRRVDEFARISIRNCKQPGGAAHCCTRSLVLGGVEKSRSTAPATLTKPKSPESA